MVDACLKGAYRLGITQPQYRCWLPLSKVGETMAILKIMHSNLCMDRGDLAQSVHDAQAAVALTIIPGSSACCPKAMSAMWFAQACRALGRVSVVRTPWKVAGFSIIFLHRLLSACVESATMCMLWITDSKASVTNVLHARCNLPVQAGWNMHAANYVCARMLTSLFHYGASSRMHTWQTSHVRALGWQLDAFGTHGNSVIFVHRPSVPMHPCSCNTSHRV